MTFTPIAPTTYVPPTQDRDGHLRDPPGAARARAAAVRLPQLDGDPRQGAGDRRHRHAREPQAVAARTCSRSSSPRTCAGSSSRTTTSTTRGNLDEAMDACPNAQLVCNWAMVERHTNCFDFPLDRCRWVMDGESLDVGDRTLQALRPPVFDSPTTRGLFDPTTGVYWAVDTFATPLPDPKMGDRRPRPGLLGLRAWRCSRSVR